MKKHLNLNPFLIVAGILIILFQRECTGSKPLSEDGDTSITVNNFYDTTIHKPVIRIIQIDSIPYSIPADFDTLAALRQYFSARIYQDSIKDSNIAGVIYTRVRQNRLDSIKFTYKLIRPVRTEVTKTTQEKKIKVFAGLHTGLATSGFKDIGPEVILVTKKDRCYKANFDFIDKSIGLGMHWKLSFKKKK
jgi:hypothetical protein